ncbi:MAG: TIGR00645 family protein [Candidatus Accumulibacter sp.]|uniref:TIGR00645 family protein n=1 Tax=Accumulibacter sp. TaxID=2053492 RepID=UPI00287A699B|nr:TIGR00645 family protein [Accumulibacter sp.]MDS4014428.1 TIGR00645 family protein [Accumulibacter sp.]
MASLKPTVDRLEMFIFWSRWLQAPLYLGLIIAQGVYVYLFMVELSHLIHNLFFSSTRINETEVMLVVLGLIDVVMIANLLIMVIIGGYETFVSRLDLEGHPDQPEWLSHVNAGVLKIKLSTAIIGISSIHLLKTFINAGNLNEHTIKWQVIIHALFLCSALAMVWVDRVMTQTLAMSKPHHAGQH